jgi:5'-3' exonuclease
MGIPRFARHLLAAYPAAFQGNVQDSFSKTSGVRLFFDFNSIIHESVRDELEALSSSGSSSIDDFETDVICEAIHRLVCMAAKLFHQQISGLATDRAVWKTKKCSAMRRTTLSAAYKNIVYVAIDGVPPRAKMQQQRFRRFAAIWHASKMAATSSNSNSSNSDSNSSDSSKPRQWDTNAITPGTRFMSKLQTMMRDSIGAIEDVLRAQVILSASDEAGEGEQKIFQYLRDHSDQQAVPTTTDIVYGLDADLILQAMLLQTSYVYDGGRRQLWIWREDSFENNTKEVVQLHVRILVDAIKDKHGCDADDFALLCVFLGNDFIPALPCISIAEGGIDLLLGLRRQALQELKEPKLVAGSRCGDVMIPPLVRILELLSQREDELMIHLEAKHRAACTRTKDGHNPDAKDNMPLISPFPDVVKCTLPGWRPRYHFHVLSLTPSTTTSPLDALCGCYLRGLLWSFRYNHQDCLDRSWYFPYRAAPTATDLYNHMSYHYQTLLTSKALERSMRLNGQREQDALRAAMQQLPGLLEDTERRLQLLMVLPPQSAHLLDACAQRLMHDVALGTCYMYPASFAFQKYMKYRTWECHPLLPCVDVYALVRALQAAEKNEFPASTS